MGKGLHERENRTVSGTETPVLLRYCRSLLAELTELSALSPDIFFLKRGVDGGGGDNSGSLSPS